MARAITWFMCFYGSVVSTGVVSGFFFFSSRRRHTRCREVSWARRCVQETAMGRTMHLGANKDEIANRIIIVGDFDRCRVVAELLTNTKETISKRKFMTITGLYNDIPISVSCGGMGVSITDFLVRESREVVSGPMAIVRPCTLR
eukprot:TRINITY_DN13861_c0_g1_i3.p3 TRINITY_DN13861_c0_g1~~TRINITY_DN13861_c0_g1_i3.p3  ORF type:complete len:145 (+),score=33.77 TRINITY_DN13861_c0_g1_i3:2-436(+)